MFLWQTLRMLADLSFYYVFAGFAAQLCGISVQFWKAAAFSLCFGWAAKSGKIGKERAAAALAAVLALWPGSFEEALVHFPATVYLAAELRKKAYGLSWYRQTDVFRRGFCILAAFFPGAALFGASDALAAAAVPMTVIFLTASVLLLRGLRHCEQVQRDWRFQTENMLTAGTVLAAVWLIQTPPAVGICRKALSAFYESAVIPILSAAVWLVSWSASGIFYGFLWLLKVLGFGEEIRSQLIQDLKGMGGQPDAFAGQLSEAGNPRFWNTIFSLLIIAAAVGGIVRLFLWLARKKPGDQEEGREAPAFSEEKTLPERKKGKRESAEIRRMRMRYRKFLGDFCGRGGVIRNGSTSGEIAEDSLWSEAEKEEAKRLTRLYRKARYGPGISAKEGKEAEQVLRRLRKGRTS